MKVVLLKNVSKVGKRFDVKEVADGFALNHLIPRGEAKAATANVLKQVEAEKAKINAEMKIKENLIAKNLKEISQAVVTIKGRANDKGALFAGLHKDVIVSALKEQTRLDIDPEFIVIEKPIKDLGEHEIEVKALDKSAKFKLVIEKE